MNTSKLVGGITIVIYLIFLLSTWGFESPQMVSLLHNHYIALVGLPFAGMLAYSVVGSLESSRGNIEFEMVGVKFKGASGPIVMWIFVFLSMVLAIKLIWPLSA